MKKIILNVSLCLTTFITAKSQVIFTDVNPDVVLNQVTAGDVSYFVDMTNDGDTDFQIINSYFAIADTTYSRSIVLPDSGNAVATDEQKNPLALTADTMINSSLNFQSENLGPLKEVTSTFGVNINFGGLWIDATDRFLGVRFKDNDTLKYGWIEMIMNTNQVTVVTTILDYAYENSGNGILTQDSLGAIGIGNAAASNDLSIFSFHNTVIVKFTGSIAEPIHIHVADMLGREIKEMITREHEVHIDLTPLTGKMCVITAQQGNEIVVKKILVM